MATPHNHATAKQIAPNVLLPGDPLRAKFVAETYLENAVCYNTVRGMLGYSGTYRGVAVAVQGTGMGIPSHLIYVTELITHYACRRLIRIGTCGSIQPHIAVRDIVVAMSASTTSGINRRRFNGCDYASCADYGLLNTLMGVAETNKRAVHVGNVLSTDEFYADDADFWKLWAAWGVLALEMETSGLYTAAAGHNAQALSILTVSDSLVAGHDAHDMPPDKRERSVTDMIELALDTLVASEAS